MPAQFPTITRGFAVLAGAALFSLSVMGIEATAQDAAHPILDSLQLNLSSSNGDSCLPTVTQDADGTQVIHGDLDVDTCDYQSSQAASQAAAQEAAHASMLQAAADSSASATAAYADTYADASSSQSYYYTPVEQPRDNTTIYTYTWNPNAAPAEGLTPNYQSSSSTSLESQYEKSYENDARSY